MIPQALLFDLDGVLTDTARFHFEAWDALCRAHGLQFDRQVNERLKGVSRRRSLTIILAHNGLSAEDLPEERLHAMEEEKNALYRRMLSGMTAADVLPGILPLLTAARASGLRLAVASASRNAPEVLSRLELTGRFDYIADAAAVPPKPDPAIFLLCAAGVGCPPGRCVGIEDASAGIAAIHSAGMRAVGIAVAPPEDPRDAALCRPDIPLSSTAQLSLPVLLSALSAL